MVVVSFYIILALFKLWPQALRNLQAFKESRQRKTPYILSLSCSASRWTCSCMGNIDFSILLPFQPTWSSHLLAI